MKIVLVGDSTVAAGGGWGPGLRAAFTSAVEVVNLARNGRSSRSFREEGAWAPVLAARPAFVIIQFGHNDCPGKGPDRETDPATTYRENMTRYVDEVRAAAATAILATSIVRRNFTPAGKITPDCLVPFVEQIRRLAAEQHLPLLDLYALTRDQAEQLGPDAAHERLNAAPVDGKPDNTHLSPQGQTAVGLLVARELARAVPALAPHLRP